MVRVTYTNVSGFYQERRYTDQEWGKVWRAWDDALGFPIDPVDNITISLGNPDEEPF